MKNSDEEMKNLMKELEWEDLKVRLETEIPVVTLGGLVQYYDEDTGWVSAPARGEAIIADGDSVCVYHKETGWCSGPYKVRIDKDNYEITFTREDPEEVSEED